MRKIFLVLFPFLIGSASAATYQRPYLEPYMFEQPAAAVYWIASWIACVGPACLDGQKFTDPRHWSSDATCITQLHQDVNDFVNHNPAYHVIEEQCTKK